MRNLNFTIEAPCAYNEAVYSLSEHLTALKRSQFSGRSMLVGVAGLSQSSKTTLSSSLEKK